MSRPTDIHNATGYADDHLHPLRVQNVQQVREILTVYGNFQKVSGFKVNMVKTSILGINLPGELLDDNAELTGIAVVTEYRYLGLQIKISYAKFSKPHTRQCSPLCNVNLKLSTLPLWIFSTGGN